MGDESERRSHGRRKWDKEMEAKVTALIAAQGQTAALLNGHLVECSRNHQESRDANLALKRTLDPLAEWVRPQIEKATARAKLWEKVYETVATDTMTFVIKWGVLFAVIAIILGSIPAGQAVFRGIKGALGL